MVMTLGGNDIKFSEIAKTCLGIGIDWYPKPCDDAIDHAYNVLASESFRNDMLGTYYKLFPKLKVDEHSQLYHILYPKLFVTDTEDCNHSRFVWPIGPLVDMKRRVDLNSLVDSLNARLEAIANEFMQRESLVNKLIIINAESFWYNNQSRALYGTHRFCEEKDRGNLRSDNVNFFACMGSDNNLDAYTVLVTSRKRTDTAYQRHELSGMNATDLSSAANSTNTVAGAPECLTRSFHPKTNGHYWMFWALYIELQRSKSFAPIAPPLYRPEGNITSSFSIGNDGNVSTF